MEPLESLFFVKNVYARELECVNVNITSGLHDSFGYFQVGNTRIDLTEENSEDSILSKIDLKKLANEINCNNEYIFIFFSNKFDNL